jgi:hypothetical protein
VSIVSAGASKAVLFETVGGSGTTSTAYLQGLAYHKDFFTMVTADLDVPNGTDSLRFVRNYDITNDKWPARFDVLLGQKVIRPGWACRLSGDD